MHFEDVLPLFLVVVLGLAFLQWAFPQHAARLAWLPTGRAVRLRVTSDEVVERIAAQASSAVKPRRFGWDAPSNAVWFVTQPMWGRQQREVGCVRVSVSTGDPGAGYRQGARPVRELVLQGRHLPDLSMVLFFASFTITAFGPGVAWPLGFACVFMTFSWLRSRKAARRVIEAAVAAAGPFLLDGIDASTVARRIAQ